MAEKKKLRMNILDVIIILTVIALVGGITLRFNLVDRLGLSGNNDEVNIRFLIQEVSPSSVEALKEGDIFYWDANSMEIGELLQKEDPMSATVVVENGRGELVSALNPKYRDVRGTIRAKGKITDEGFMLDGTQFLSAGKYLNVSSKNIKVTILITDISAVE